MNDDWVSPPDVDAADAHVEDVLELATDDYALWIVADAPCMDLPAEVSRQWATRVRSRLRTLDRDDLVRAVELLLTAQAYSRAENLLWTTREADPDDLDDGPWST